MSSAQCRGVQGSAGRCRAGRAHAKTASRRPPTANTFCARGLFLGKLCDRTLFFYLLRAALNVGVSNLDIRMPVSTGTILGKRIIGAEHAEEKVPEPAFGKARIQVFGRVTW